MSFKHNNISSTVRRVPPLSPQPPPHHHLLTTMPPSPSFGQFMHHFASLVSRVFSIYPPSPCSLVYLSSLCPPFPATTFPPCFLAWPLLQLVHAFSFSSVLSFPRLVLSCLSFLPFSLLPLIYPSHFSSSLLDLFSPPFLSLLLKQELGIYTRS